MIYAVAQGISIKRDGLRLTQGDRVTDDMLPASVIQELVSAGHIIADETEKVKHEQPTRTGRSR
jgi:hypothetical protein